LSALNVSAAITTELFIIGHVSQKVPLYLFNNSVKKQPFTIIFGIKHRNETWLRKVVNLPTAPVKGFCTILEVQKWFLNKIQQ